MKSFFIIGLVVFLFTGCYVEKHNITPTTQIDRVFLEPASKVYIAKPEDGSFGQIKYYESGFAVASTLKNNIFRYTKDIIVSNKITKLDDALLEAKKENSKYLFYPTILLWEDRATQWSGKSDKIHINITVIDVLTGKEISSTDIKSNSSFWTLRNASPAELLEEPLSQYINSLYQ